jgi:hypothetical protein
MIKRAKPGEVLLLEHRLREPPPQEQTKAQQQEPSTDPPKPGKVRHHVRYQASHQIREGQRRSTNRMHRRKQVGSLAVGYHDQTITQELRNPPAAPLSTNTETPGECSDTMTAADVRMVDKNRVALEAINRIVGFAHHL